MGAGQDLQRSLEAVARERQAQNFDHMPGLTGETAQERLVAQLAENVIILYRENLALKEQIAALTPPKT